MYAARDPSHLIMPSYYANYAPSDVRTIYKK